MADDASQDGLVQQFCGITGAAPEQATEYLQLASWSLEQAVNNFYTATGDGQEEVDSQSLPHLPPLNPNQGPLAHTLSGATVPFDPESTMSLSNQDRAKSKKVGASSSRPRLATIADLSSGENHQGRQQPESDDDENDPDFDPAANRQPQNFFAGGGKSGIAVQNPNQDGGNAAPGGGEGPGSGRNLISGILRQAADESRRRAEGGRIDSDDDTDDSTGGHMQASLQQSRAAARREASRFTGAGYTLGSEIESLASVTVGQNSAALQRTRTDRIHRRLTFWRDGFSIEDGPLLRYDENREVLASIHAGRAPYQIMSVEPGQAADVEIVRRMDEDYIPPKQKQGGFRGTANRLGTELQDGGTQGATPTLPQSDATAQVPKKAEDKPHIDESQPVIKLQIRKADGTRLTVTFNASHTVGDVRQFVTRSDALSGTRAWVLAIPFPMKPLVDESQALTDIPELKKGGVVVQRWS